MAWVSAPLASRRITLYSTVAVASAPLVVSWVREVMRSSLLPTLGLEVPPLRKVSLRSVMLGEHINLQFESELTIQIGRAHV